MNFLLATFVYRFANGMLFLAVAWNLVTSSSNGAVPLAISAITGFLPALLIAPFAKRLLALGNSRGLVLQGIGGLLLAALALSVAVGYPLAMLVVNFFVLLVFFLLEGAWDALLATVAHRLPPEQAEKLNSRQSGATQAGLMLGGLPIGLLVQWGGAPLPFLVAAALYVLAIGIFLLPGLRALTRREASATVQQAARDASEAQLPPVGWATLFTLALVWPCLTLVNMVMPLVVYAQAKGVEQAAVLDACIGLGMAFIGITHERLHQLPESLKQRFTLLGALLIPLPFLAILLTEYSLVLLAGAFFLCGVGFGMFRIGIRKHLIDSQPAHRVGQIVTVCNGWGFPVLTVAALAYAYTWTLGPVVPLIAFSVFALVGLAASISPLRSLAAARA